MVYHEWYLSIPAMSARPSLSAFSLGARLPAAEAADAAEAAQTAIAARVVSTRWARAVSRLRVGLGQ